MDFAVGSVLQISLIILLLAAGVVNDLQSRKVRNPIILIGLAVGLITMTVSHGFSGLSMALLSMMTAFIAVLPMYLMKALGGGDVKLLVAASTLMNWKTVLITLFASLIWGSILGILQAVLQGKGKALAHNMLALSFKAKLPEEHTHKIPYTVALLFGYLSSLVVSGGLA